MKGTGSIGNHNQKYLTELIKKNGFKKCLELGTHLGISGEAILKGMNNGIFCTVDIVDVNRKDTEKYKKYKPEIFPIDRFKAYNSSVLFYNKGSDDFFNLNKNLFDFIFIDGSHKKENVMKDIINSLSRLEKDGLILLHDYYPNGQPLFENKPAITGPYLAVKELLKNIDFEFKIVPEYLGQTMSFALIWKKGEMLS